MRAEEGTQKKCVMQNKSLKNNEKINNLGAPFSWYPRVHKCNNNNSNKNVKKAQQNSNHCPTHLIREKIKQTFLIRSKTFILYFAEVI